MNTKDPSTRRLVERLEAKVADLEAVVKTVQREARTEEPRHTYLALTTCSPDDEPNYPDPPANTFRIAFVDARFDPTPGMQASLYKVRHRPTVKYSATARNISGGWVPEGTPVMATWQRCFGGPDHGEWWFEYAAANYAEATLSKPLLHHHETAFLAPGAVDVESGLPVKVFKADNTWLHWQGLAGDRVILRSTYDGWKVWLPQMHGVCMVKDVVDSESNPPEIEGQAQHPGALTKVELMASMNFGEVPTKPCSIVDYALCVEDGGSGSGSGGGVADFDAPFYQFAYDIQQCCEAGSVGSGSEFSGSDDSGLCETGLDMTGEF